MPLLWVFVNALDVSGRLICWVVLQITFLFPVMATTANGGVCEVKMDDGGRLTHIWWQTREQVGGRSSCPKRILPCGKSVAFK